MDVLIMLLWIIGAVIAIGLAIAALSWLWEMTIFFWPAILGISGCIWLWLIGHDNIAIVIAITGIIGEYFWMKKLDQKYGGHYDPMAGKSRIYNKSGNIVGYRDPD